MSEDPGERLVDARGLHCPAPVIRLAAAARDAPEGTVLRVLSTDPAARYDIPAWARIRGHTVLSTTPLATGDGDDQDAAAAYETRVQLGPESSI